MSLNCKYELDGRVFQTEEALDEYIKLNKDLKNVGDYRFSKNKPEDYVKLISETNDRVEKTLNENNTKKVVMEKMSNPKNFPLEEIETYNDGYTSMTTLAEELSDKRMSYNESNYFSELYDTLKRELAQSFPNNAELEKEIQKRIEEKKQSIEDIRAAGKGLHNFVELIFADKTFNTSKINSYIKKRREYIKLNYEKASLDKFDDQTLYNLAVKILQIKRRLQKGKNVAKTFTESYLDYDSNAAKFRGKMDSVIVYDDGTIDVIDFKISETPWEAADPNKRTVAENQLHLYKIALENLGVKSSDVKLYVFPITVKREGDKYTSTTVEEGNIVPLSYKPEFRSNLITKLHLQPENQPVDTEIGKTTIANQGKMFGFDTITYQKDDINFKVAWDLLVGPPKGDTYSFRSPSTGQTFSSKSREKIENDLYNELQVAKEARQQYAVEIKNKINGMKRKSTALLSFIQNTESSRFTIDFRTTRNSWLNRELYKYKVEEGWRAVDNPDLFELGVIMFQNDITREIDLVSLTYDNIWGEVKLKYGNNLLGNYKSDKDVPAIKKMVPTLGNMELIKLMDIANQIDTDYSIGELKVLSLYNLAEYRSTGVRDKLTYNYNVLAHETGVEPRKFEFTDTYEQILNEGRVLLAKENTIDGATTSDAGAIQKQIQDLSNIKSKSEKLSALQELRDYIAYKYYNGNKDYKTDDSILGRFYNDLNQAIADLSNITLDFYNVSTLSSSLTGGNFKDSFKNKRFFNSTLLNTADTIPLIREIYNMFEDAGNKLRDAYYTYKTLDRQHTDKFKASASPLYANKVVNRYEVVYSNLFDKSERGKTKFLLKDYRTDTSLNNEERAYLKWWLEEVNKIRFKGKTLEDLEGEGLGEKWFEVPLLRAEMASQIINNKKGIKDAIWDQAGFDPVVDAKMAMGVSYVKTDFGHNQLLFDKMYNVFALSEDEDSRNKLLQELGPETFETNLERIKDMYKFSDLRQKIYNPPLARASAAISAYAFNVQMGNITNEHKDSIEYLVEYIRSSVMDESLVKDDYKDALRIVNVLRSNASRLVLGFNILSTFKEGIVGFATLVNNAFANRHDDTRFGMQDALKAYTAVWKDSVHQIDTITIGEHLNFQYGMANMSIQELVERMNFFQGQVGRADDRIFWCTRVCDYLHRMTIFYAYMNKYDCLKAHKVVNGHVEYDWKLDGRFSIYAKYNNESEVPPSFKEKWREQRSLFEAMRNQMVEDGVEYVSDWSTGERKRLEYTDNFLPRAFTNNEARKIIQESNMMYGYMDNANKSLFFKKGIGILIGQFQTYISAKKNQYFLSPDVYQNGHWVFLKDEQGRQLYRTYDADGNPQMTTEDNGNPIKVWEGSMMGGIFWSLKSLAECALTKEGRQRFKEVWNDPNNRRNIDILFGDIFAALSLFLVSWMLYGGMTKSELSYWDRNVQKVLNNASNELNMYKVFTGQLEFRFTSYEIVSGFLQDLWSTLTGQMNLAQALASNVGVFRPYRDMIYDYIKENE